MTALRVVFCSVSTWKNTCGFGEHYYGRLHYKGQQSKVEHPLSEKEVRRLNQGDPGVPYKVGEESVLFFDEDTLKEWAIKCCRKLFPDANMLVYGDTSVVEPQPVLFGPKKVMKEVNAWYQHGVEIGFFDEDPGVQNEWDAICDRWAAKYTYWREE